VFSIGLGCPAVSMLGRKSLFDYLLDHPLGKKMLIIATMEDPQVFLKLLYICCFSRLIQGPLAFQQHQSLVSTTVRSTRMLSMSKAVQVFAQ